MNLLRIIPSMDPSSGGPCQGIRNSIPELEKLGIHNEVLCLDNPEASFLGNESFKIHALGHWKGPWRYSSKLFSWLLQNISRFDVIIVHGIWLYHSYTVNKVIRLYKAKSSRRFLKERMPKYFVMPHGMLDPYFQHASGRKFKSIRNWVYWKLIEEKVVNNADGILFTCKQELLLARKPFSPYRPKSEISVGYGIAAPPPYRAEMCRVFSSMCPELKDNPYFLFLGRIHKKKSVDLLINVYATLIKEIRIKEGCTPKLVIAGPGIETSFGKRIKRMIDKDLDKLVLFPGMLSGDAKWGALYGCEAFMLPSHQENFGIAVVEAMACEKPVLISNQVNIWREIKEEGGGIIADDTKKGILEIFNKWFKLSDMEKQLMGKNARKTYEKHFTIDSAVKQLFNTISNEL